MRFRLVKEPFDHPDYLFELKHDGFRAVVYIEDGQCRLVSRNMKLLRFDSLRDSLAKLPVQDAILDSEIVCVDSKGVSQFNQLLDRKAEPILYAFDLQFASVSLPAGGPAELAYCRLDSPSGLP
jgi:bifunctional non-homologous end joining protein LigD